MALPKEPRQKMINLMYLVLTALLALNVSAEILNAFKTVDNSLNKTNNAIDLSTADIMESFRTKLTEPKTAEKAKIWYPKAQSAEQISDDMYKYIDNLRNQIRKEAVVKADGSIEKEDNQDIATRIMIKEGKGKELQDKLAKYKKDMLDIISNDPSLSAADKAKHTEEIEKYISVDASLPTGLQGGNKTFADAYFHMVPTVAAMTILRKFQNDVKTSENRVVGYLHSQVDKVAIRFNSYEAVVSQSSNYLMPGQQLEVKAALAAFNSENKPIITIGGSGVNTDEKGMATQKIDAGTIGEHTVPVTVKFKDQDGNDQVRTFDVKYTVGQANASIALDKMNVLYIGVDNPISVAASGGGDDKVQVSISGGGGAISKVGAGKYNVRVGSPSDDCVITVSVDGKVAGSSRFRVRNIPAPTGSIGGFASGDNVNAGALKAQSGAFAYIKDFPFDIKYDVISYSLSIDNAEGDIETADVQGNMFSNRVRQIITQNAQPGRTLTIDNMRAKGPDGRVFKIPSLVYYVK